MQVLKGPSLRAEALRSTSGENSTSGGGGIPGRMEVDRNGKGDSCDPCDFAEEADAERPEEEAGADRFDEPANPIISSSATGREKQPSTELVLLAALRKAGRPRVSRAFFSSASTSRCVLIEDREL